MIRTRVKICGITRPEDGLVAARLGADAIGLVFYPQSSRAVDVPTARRIIAALPPFVTVVGLFVDAEPAAVRAILRQVPLGMLQFHGWEDPDYCSAFGIPYIKAVPMGASVDVGAYDRRFAAAAGLLLDSHGGAIPVGGSGRRFDWAKIPREMVKPIILAGGLDSSSVVEAIRQVRPWAIDVSSGVESAKGIKDTALLRAFMQAVAQGDSHA
ncbi:MAG: phosphoribosylanthranilate isomerase [Candidatus Competibacteraceae bacterium]